MINKSNRDWTVYLDVDLYVRINDIELYKIGESNEKIVWKIERRLVALLKPRVTIATITLDKFYYMEDGKTYIKWAPEYKFLSTDEKLIVNYIINIFNLRNKLNACSIPEKKVKETIKLPKSTLSDDELNNLSKQKK